MKNIIIIIILSSITTYAISAQSSLYSDTLIHKYDRNTIYLKKGGFEKNGQTIRFGALKKNLKKELTASPMALQEYKRSRTNFWVAMSCTVVSTALTLSGIQRKYIYKELSYSGLSLSLLTIPFNIKAQNQLNRAVWLYNREAILRK